MPTFPLDGPASADTSPPTAGAELDVRAAAPARRHQLVFSAWQALPVDRSFVLVNDHDPKPLLLPARRRASRSVQLGLPAAGSRGVAGAYRPDSAIPWLRPIMTMAHSDGVILEESASLTVLGD